MLIIFYKLLFIYYLMNYLKINNITGKKQQMQKKENANHHQEDRKNESCNRK